jgi:hypothetical protein
MRWMDDLGRLLNISRHRCTAHTHARTLSLSHTHTHTSIQLCNRTVYQVKRLYLYQSRARPVLVLGPFRGSRRRDARGGVPTDGVLYGGRYIYIHYILFTSRGHRQQGKPAQRQRGCLKLGDDEYKRIEREKMKLTEQKELKKNYY